MIQACQGDAAVILEGVPKDDNGGRAGWAALVAEYANDRPERVLQLHTQLLDRKWLRTDDITSFKKDTVEVKRDNTSWSLPIESAMRKEPCAKGNASLLWTSGRHVLATNPLDNGKTFTTVSPI